MNQLLKELSPSVSDEKRQAIEAYFWMVEEYKVSVFAQELKTAMPISAKRLEMKLGEIGRMVWTSEGDLFRAGAVQREEWFVG